MWVFLNNAFFSAVADRNDKTRLVVRARMGGDLERTFPEYADKVIESGDSDYRFRIFISRNDFATVMFNQSLDIQYDNFKNSIPQEEDSRYRAYTGVWSVMNKFQEQKYPGRYMDRMGYLAH
jgi:hypothetical protein